MSRQYHLDSVNIRTGERTRLTGYPMSHKEICTIKSKCSEHPHRRLELVEYVTLATEDKLLEMLKCGG